MVKCELFYALKGNFCAQTTLFSGLLWFKINIQFIMATKSKLPYTFKFTTQNL